MRNQAFRSILASSLLAFAALSFTGGSAHAGDCRGVKFHFVNQTGEVIMVRNAKIKGNDGDWTENFADKIIQRGGTHTTAKRVLNKLDSGAEGDFTITYAVNPAIGTRVSVVSQTFTGLKCTDDITFTFTLTKNSH